MAIPKEAYETLKSIVGHNWVSDDPAICAADQKGGAGTGIRDVNALRPAVSIQPSSAEEVRQIVKVANRYQLPYIPTSTFFTAECSPNLPNTIMMDLKRMDKFEINEKDMYAICEPGVSFGMLQAELLKRGLFTFVPGSGSQCSVVANHCHCGDAPLQWRHGLGYRRMLAVEWILPNGDVLNVGTRSVSDEFFWGAGPGPDLRGILRGARGFAGGLGTAVKMAVKIFSFIPERLIPSGVGPHATLNLPENKMIWYNCRFPTLDKLADAIYDLGKCEIGLIVFHIDPIFGYVARSRGRGANYFWEEWKKAKDVLDPKQGWLRVLLVGFTSEKQLAFEERVFLDIIADHGATAKLSRPLDETNIVSADAISANFAGRRFLSVLYFESLDHALKVGRYGAELKNDYIPPLADTYGIPGWYVPCDFAHSCKEESLNYGDVDDVGALGALYHACRLKDVEMGAYPFGDDPKIFGPVSYNYNKKLEAVKELLDPNNVSNPPQPAARVGGQV